MDPQKNPQSPTQDNADQQPAAIQMPQGGAPSSEVTVDFSQDASASAPGTVQPDAAAGGFSPAGSDSSVSAASPDGGGTFSDPSAVSRPDDQDTQMNVPATDSTPDPGLGGNAGSPLPQTPAQPPADPYASPSVQPAAGDFPDTGAETQPPLNPADSSGAGVPPTAPVPASKADKKTVMILGVVAVVLILAIAVLFFM